MSSPVMSCIPSPQPCSPRHSRHWWQPRSLEVATESESDCRPARRMRCRGRGPRTNLACIPIPGPLPSPHREAQPAIGVRVGVDRGGGLPGWFFGRQGEDQSEDRSEDRSEDLRRIGVRIGVRIVGGGGPRAVVPRRRVRIVPASSSPRRPRHRRRRRNRQHLAAVVSVPTTPSRRRPRAVVPASSSPRRRAVVPAPSSPHRRLRASPQSSPLSSHLPMSSPVVVRPRRYMLTSLRYPHPVLA